MNKWELFELAKEVLTDVGLINNEEFHEQTIGLMTTHKDSDDILSVHLTRKGFDMFMEHVRARAEQIGEEVREPFATFMGQFPDTQQVIWAGVPGLEFMCLRVVDK